MTFDPDKFLAETEEFNPDEFLAETEETSEDMFSLDQKLREGAPTKKEAIARGATQGLTFGFGDELGAAALSPLETLRRKAAELIEGTPEHTDKMLREQGFTGDIEDKDLTEVYKEMRDASRGADKEASDTHPYSYLGGELAGGIAPALLTGGGTAAAGVAKTGAKQAIKQAAKVGAGYGAVSGAGYSEADDLGGLAADTAIGTAIGAGAGAGLPLLGKGLKEGAKKLGSGAKDFIEAIIPESAAIKAGYAYGKQGKKITQEVLDEDLKGISRKILDNIKADKNNNNLTAVKDKLDSLGIKVQTKEAINEAVEDLEKLVKGDFLDVQNKELLPKLKGLLGHDEQSAKMLEKAKKAILKKSVESEGKETQALIKAEKDLAKTQEIGNFDLTGEADELAKIVDDIGPTIGDEGLLVGKQATFETPDRGSFTKKSLSDATPYQPEVSKMLGPEGRPVIKTIDKGSGKVSAIVGNIEDKLELKLNDMTITEVEALRKQLNLVTKLARAQGAADDPIMQRAQQLAGKLKNLTDEAIEKHGDRSLIDKRSRFSDIFTAEEMLGVNKRLAPRSDVDTFKKTLSISEKLGFEKGFKTRQEGEIAQEMLGSKVVTPEMKSQLDLIKKLNQISGRESQENISKAGLYKMAVGDVPNLVGRGVKKAADAAEKVLSPVKSTVEAISKMTVPQIEKLATKYSSSENKGVRYIGEQITKAMALEGPAQSQAVWVIAQSPAFRELLKREIPAMEEEMLSDLGLETDAQKESEETPSTINRHPSRSRIDNLDNREGFKSSVYKDTEGYDTIGVGHKITPENKKTGTIYGISYKNGITREQANIIKNKDVEYHDKEAYHLLDKFGIDKESLSEVQLDAIKDMVFQLGAKNASTFINTFTDIKNKEYDKASENVSKSKWAKQTPKRTKDFQDRIIKPKKESVPNINQDNIPQGQRDQEARVLESPSEEDITDLEDSIDMVNQQQSSGDNIPVHQIDDLMGKIDALTISEDDKNTIENEAINMASYSDGSRLKELLRKISELK